MIIAKTKLKSGLYTTTSLEDLLFNKEGYIEANAVIPAEQYTKEMKMRLKI